MIMVARGRLKAQARAAPATTEAIRMKNEFSNANGMNSL
jgi:hypothetical protein